MFTTLFILILIIHLVIIHSEKCKYKLHEEIAVKNKIIPDTFVKLASIVCYTDTLL